MFTLKSSTLSLVGFGVLAYALLEGVEAVGLWWQKRWAEYLTLIATAVFIPQSRQQTTSLSTLAAQFGLAVPSADAGQSPALYADLLQGRQVPQLLGPRSRRSPMRSDNRRVVAIATPLELSKQCISLGRK